MRTKIFRAKRGYLVSVNYVTNEIFIRSRIFFNFLNMGTTPAGASNIFIDPTLGPAVAGAPPYTLGQLRMNSFMHYVQREIQEVWNSELNRGLQSNFNGSPFRVRTTISVQLANNAPRTLRNGEVMINVWPGPGRSFIDGNSNYRVGSFYYDDMMNNRINLTPGNIRFVAVPAGGGGNPPPAGTAANTVIGDYFTGGFPQYDFAHEFGHVLGLADRYHTLVNMDYINTTALSDYLISPHLAPFNRPMFLPGYYDPEVPEPTSNLDLYLNPELPHYNQGPYPLNKRGQAQPQSNYSKMPYDVDYSVRFGWMHNLMSTKLSPHIPGFNPFAMVNPTYEYVYNNDPSLNTFIPNIFPAAAPIPFADPVHNATLPLIGSATNVGSQKTLIITNRQLSIILSYFLVEQDEFEQIFQRFVFAKDNSINSTSEPYTLNNVVFPSSPRKFDLNNGSFVGLSFDEYNEDFSLEPNETRLDSSTIVSDEVYDIIQVLPPVLIIAVQDAITVGVPIPPPPPGSAPLNPIVITTNVPHGLIATDLVTITNVAGVPPANVNLWPVQIIGPNQFLLLGTDFIVAPIPPLVAFAYLGGGTVEIVRAQTISVPILFYVVQIGATTIGNNILITTNRDHGFQTGDQITITNVQASLPALETATNGTFLITVIDNINFSIPVIHPGGVYNPGASTSTRGRITIGIGAAPGGVINSGGQIQVISDQPHSLSTGDQVTIQGALGVPNANGRFTITVLNRTSFLLNNSIFAGGPYAGGATILASPHRLGIDDVMDYRMSSFSTHINSKNLFEPKSNRFDIYGFFSIDPPYSTINRGVYSDTVNFPTIMEPLLKGSSNWSRFFRSPRLNSFMLDHGETFDSDNFAESGYFYTANARNAWNASIQGGNIANLTPNYQPQGWSLYYAGGMMVVLQPGTLPVVIGAVWVQGGDPNKWINTTTNKIYGYLIYPNRLTIILLP